MGEKAPYIEIETKFNVYRFYGLGRWQVRGKLATRWVEIHGMFIPGDVLQVAAARSEKKPLSMARNRAALVSPDQKEEG
jgi:hypothetical protein